MRDHDHELHWSAVERLPTSKRLRTSLFDGGEDKVNHGEHNSNRMVDVTKLGAEEKRLLVDSLIKHIENDNLRLLQRQKHRIDRVDVKLPTIEVRYNELCVEAECQVVQGKPLPTLWNATKGFCSSLFRFMGLYHKEAKISIIKDVSGIIKPSRMTLLLGPPGCGKTTFLLALAGKLDKSLEIRGDVSYNGFKLDEFIPEKTASYISQNDLHIAEMTVREILDFSACFQGVGSRAEIMKEVIIREKQSEIVPEPDIDTYMKAISVGGLGRSIQTDYVLKIMGMDICADIMVGDAMRRGISGGQKKRLTTAEFIVGPTKALFMDEISTGLDSSTTFQIVTCLQQLAHISEATIVVSLLQPAPETYDLFYDIILMAEGKIVYQGPRDQVLAFFEECGFRCPERKGEADFLQEVLSRKDQEQYWYHLQGCYSYVSVDDFSQQFRSFHIGKKLEEDLSKPYDKSQCHKNALSFNLFSLPKCQLFRACMARELLLMKRNSHLYIFKTVQLAIMASISMTVFLRTRVGIDAVHANYYMGSLFFALLLLMVIGISEITLTLSRLPSFYKQRDYYFYPAWAYSIPAIILKVPVSLIESFIWTSLTYYVIGYSPEAGRFFRHFLLLFCIHQMALSMFRFTASCLQTEVIGLIGSNLLMLVSAKNMTLGDQVLISRGLHFKSYFYWVSVGALLGYALLFNVGFTLALSLKRPVGVSRAIISCEKLSQMNEGDDLHDGINKSSPGSATVGMREQGYKEKNLKLLHNITGAFRPGVLSVLMGVSGAGKTTLLDVLSGRKTGGIIEGDIRIGGYQKVQETFARISGYCEQTDVHSSQITVEESLIYSAWLRLPQEIDSQTRSKFMHEVLETIELDSIKDTLVGVPGVNGLSTEQRKRLTIAVELVANPSILFMDEPTSGLDARAAAIVMRAVKNVAETGRTVVCTIHQPSIDIFEAFDELMLIKPGGKLIYSGPLGEQSCKRIPGVPKIKQKYNPATWMLEVTSTSLEQQLGIDFAEVYVNSSLYGDNKELVKQLSLPPPGSRELHFPTRFAQNSLVQFKACLWKQYLSYWRSPSYNLARLIFMFFTSVIFGLLFWNHGKRLNNQQNLFDMLGSMYGIVIFTGVNNCGSVIPFVTAGRNIFYREIFAGMYSPWTYSLAQVVIEIPCVFILTLMFMLIAYPSIGYYWTAYKFLWFFYTMFCSLLIFVYLGMLLASLTPNVQSATVLSSFFYQNFHLFSGFILPGPHIPKWWIWLYNIMPMSWMLNALFASQYGDIQKEITVLGETKSVAIFLQDYFGFHYDRLGLVALILLVFPFSFASLFAYCIGKLNFQRR
ncbi:putative ABC-type xenobiotic transporter [Dioscorea sansibarensis]